MSHCQKLQKRELLLRLASEVQVNVYGALTITEERRLQSKIEAADRTEEYPAKTEEALLAAVNADLYSKFYLLLEMAELREVQSQRVSLTRLVLSLHRMLGSLIANCPFYIFWDSQVHIWH
jgi:hypothetical protein